MALPHSFGTSIYFSSDKSSNLGPFTYSGNLYIIGVDTANNTVEVWKSTDNGDTWTEQDAAHHPSCHATAIYKSASGSLRSGSTKLWVTYFAPSGGVIRYFDLTNNTWNSTVSAIFSGGVGYIPVVFMQSAERADGKVVILANNYGVDMYSDVYTEPTYCVYNPANNTFTVSSTYLYDGADSYIDGWCYALAIDSTDRCYFFWSVDNSATLYYHTLSSANVLSAQQTAVTNYQANTTQGANAVTYTYSGTEYVAVAYVTSATGHPLAIARGTVGATPTFTSYTVSATTTSNPEYTTANTGSLASFSGTLCAFWSDDITNDGYRNTSSDGGVTWGSDEEWLDVSTINAVCINPLSNGIGFLYDNNGTVYYNAYVPPLTVSVTAGSISLSGTTVTLNLLDVPVITPYSFPTNVGAGGALGANSGPFYYNGNMYVALWNSSTHYITIYMSSDKGNTWNEQDSAHHPACVSTGGILGCTGFPKGSLLYIAYLTTTTNLVVRTFDCSTNLWSSVTAGLTIVNPTYGVLMVVVNSSDNIYVCYTATASYVGYYAKYSSGAWGTPVAIGTSSFLYPNGMIIDNTDRITFILSNANASPSAFYAQVLTSGGVLKTPVQINASSNRYAVCTIHTVFTYSSTTYIGTVLFFTGSPYVKFVSWVPADTIGTIYTTTVSTSATFNDGTGTVVSVMSDSNGNLCAILSDSGTHMWITSSPDGGATWTVPEEVNSGTESIMSAALLPTTSSPTGIGFVYGTSSAAKYDYIPIGWTGVKSTISGDWPTFNGAQIGPWESQGNIYVLSTNVSTGAITMKYSADGGATWNAITTNQPSSCTTTGFIGGTTFYLASNTSIYVAYFVDNKTINVMPFACTPDGGSWGSALGTLAIGSSASTSPQFLQITGAASNNIVVLFNYYYSVTYQHVTGYAKWTTSWSAVAALYSAANNYPIGICVDTNSPAIFSMLYQYSSTCAVRTWNGTTLATAVSVSAAVYATSNSAASHVISFTLGGTIYVCVGLISSTSPYHLYLYYWTSATTPSGIANSVISTVNTSLVPPLYTNTNICTFAFDGFYLYCYWFGKASSTGFGARTDNLTTWLSFTDWGSLGVVGKGISAGSI